MKRHPVFNRVLQASMAATALLPGVGCSMELRSGVVSGVSSFVADATYGILAELLPIPLGSGGNGGNGGGDPFENDEPLQM